MKIIKILLVAFLSIAAFESCKEEGRFDLSADDLSVPPPPEVISVKPTNGGARVFFKPNTDPRVLQTLSEYTSTSGEVFRTSVSYFKDSLDVYGFFGTDAHTFYLYNETRSGVQSVKVPVEVAPEPAAITLVAQDIRVGPSFSAMYVEWINELGHSVNVFVDIEFRDRSAKYVFTSSRDSVRQFIYDLNLNPDEIVYTKVSVGDNFGNRTPPEEVQLTLLSDSEIHGVGVWSVPVVGDSIGGVPMMFGGFAEGAVALVMDGILDKDDGVSNYLHTGGVGRIGMQYFDFPLNTLQVPDRNRWNLLINLGGYYELSRIVTHQRYRYNSGSNGEKGILYRDENVGRYAVWYLDEDDPDGIESVLQSGETVKGTWVRIMEHVIPVPMGIWPAEYPALYLQGDAAFMYPASPKFTAKTRWFRYEAIAGFDQNYTAINNNCLSEIRLFGRPVNN